MGMKSGGELVPVDVNRNQCDGCQAGKPLKNGAHRMGREGGYPDYMSCQRSKYQAEINRQQECQA